MTIGTCIATIDIHCMVQMGQYWDHAPWYAPSHQMPFPPPEGGIFGGGRARVAPNSPEAKALYARELKAQVCDTELLANECECIMVWCSVLQCVAVCCSVLQCGAACCSKLQRVAVCCSVLQCVVLCRSVLQCVAVRCNVLLCVAVCCSVLQRVAMCCSVLQCFAVCCSVLQCVAVCCNALLCVAVCCSVLVSVIRTIAWLVLSHHNTGQRVCMVH